MMFLIVKPKKGFFKKKLPLVFIDDKKEVCEEPMVRRLKQTYDIDIEKDYKRYTDFYIPDPLFDMLCESLGRNPAEEQINLLKSYWEDIKKVLDK